MVRRRGKGDCTCRVGFRYQLVPSCCSKLRGLAVMKMVMMTVVVSDLDDDLGLDGKIECEDDEEGEKDD